MAHRPRITIVGAGNVGASVAQWAAAKELGDIVLVDIIEGLPEGKALDLWESGPMGGHGDEMVPLPRYCTVSGIPITQLLPCDKIQKIIDQTIDAGAEIVKLLKTGSAFVSPGAAVAEMAEAILRDKKRVMPCSVYLEGEYGLNNLYFGVPVKLGLGGVEEIIEVELTEEERRLMERSATLIKKSISSLGL